MPTLDSFVLPSKAEPFGLAILEAMALGILVATFSDSGGLVDIRGESGFVVTSPAELVDIITKLNKNQAYWEQVSAEVRKRAAQFTIDKMADRLSRLYY